MKKIFSLFIFLAGFYCCKAQDSTKWQYSAALNFTAVPTLNISGRDTSFRNSLSFAPTISVRNENGLGLSYAPEFVIGGASPGLYAHDLTFGYESYNKKNVDFFADFNHYFFTGNKSIPYTPISNEFFSEVTYKQPWIRPMLSLGVGFGTNKETVNHNFVSDVAIAAGISHLFYKELNDGSFSFEPALKINAGTNEYFSLMHSSKYISANKNFSNLIKKKKGTGAAKANKGLTFNNIETAFDATYEIGSFSIHPETSLIFPVFSKKDKSPIFIWQLELNYDF